MRKLGFVGLAGAIALSLASCASDSGGNVATSPSPAAPSPAAKPATSQPFGTKAAPLVAQKPPAENAIPGLIQSTNGDERAKQVQASIDGQKKGGKDGQEGKDPFAGLPPKLQQPSTPANRQNVPTVPQLPATPKLTNPKPTTTAFNPKTPLPPSKTPVIKTLPPLPSTTIANAVEVSGVAVIGGVPQAIVKAPNEETSRYVRVGQRLSNGQVLVKRIEMNNGAEPIVILEENGVEVSRAVGATVQPTKPA